MQELPGSVKNWKWSISDYKHLTALADRLPSKLLYIDTVLLVFKSPMTLQINICIRWLFPLTGFQFLVGILNPNWVTLNELRTVLSFRVGSVPWATWFSDPFCRNKTLCGCWIRVCIQTIQSNSVNVHSFVGTLSNLNFNWFNYL